MPDTMMLAHCLQNRTLTMWAKLILIVAVATALIVIPSVTRADECPTTPNLPSSDGSQPANLGVLKLHIKGIRAAFGPFEGGPDILRSPDFQGYGFEADHADRCLSLTHVQHGARTADVG
jgi:hypothetical protein